MSEAWPPEHAELLVSFEVSGDPKGAGSKDAIPLGRWRFLDGARRFIPILRDGAVVFNEGRPVATGVPVVNVVDTADKTGGPEWSGEIRHQCAQALNRAHELHDGPMAVRVVFYGKSPKARYGTGRNAERLKPNADRLPHQSDLPDGTKLARRLEDALNGLCWTDDRRVTDMWWSRAFGRHPGARVDIYGLPARFCDVPGELEAVASPDQLVILQGDDGDSDTNAGPSRALLERARRAVGVQSVGRGDGRGEAARDQAVELQA